MSPLTGLAKQLRRGGYKHAAPPGLAAYCRLPTAYFFVEPFRPPFAR